MSVNRAHERWHHVETMVRSAPGSKRAGARWIAMGLVWAGPYVWKQHLALRAIPVLLGFCGLGIFAVAVLVEGVQARVPEFWWGVIPFLLIILPVLWLVVRFMASGWIRKRALAARGRSGPLADDRYIREFPNQHVPPDFTLAVRDAVASIYDVEPVLIRPSDSSWSMMKLSFRDDILVLELIAETARQVGRGFDAASAVQLERALKDSWAPPTVAELTAQLHAKWPARDASEEVPKTQPWRLGGSIEA